jgi:ADP-ribose pyrophosphatase YjhB (NUDIX family)
MQPSIGIGATIAIIEEDRILLTKREDFEIWCMPGGQIDPGESLADAAVREAREETGLEVELTRLVCLSSRVGGGQEVHMPIFAAKVVGGTLSPQVDEVIDIGYFAAEELPANLIPWHRRPALDALSGLSGAVYSTTINTPLPVQSRRELYAMRDASGLSRLAFFKQIVAEEGSIEIERQV